MLQVKQVLQQDLDYRIHNLAYSHCLNVDLPDSALAKYYSGTRLAEYITQEASSGFMYVLYEDTEPIGIYILEPTYPIHLSCLCVVDSLLFILEHRRSLKNLMYLVKTSIRLIQQEFSEPFVLAVGSTLGSPILPDFYKRIGFVEAGTQLVLELIGTRQRKHI